MSRPTSEPRDDRLRDLLAVEARLQRLVADAREAADRRVADAHGASAHLLTDANAAVADRDADEARRDQAAHAEARLALEERHQAVIASLTAVPDDRIDRLARRALAHLLEPPGGPS